MPNNVECRTLLNAEQGSMQNNVECRTLLNVEHCRPVDLSCSCSQCYHCILLLLYFHTVVKSIELQIRISIKYNGMFGSSWELALVDNK